MSRRARILFLIAGSTVLTGVLAAQQTAPAATNPLGSTSAAIAAGQTLFNQVCQSCHGPGAQGSDRGPALTGTLKNGNTDADLFRTIRNGVPGTQMVAFGSFTEAQVWQLVSFVRSTQGGAPAAAPAGSATGDVADGEAVFFAKGGCSDCHEVNGRGSVGGPDLSNAGRLTPDVLRQKVIAPETVAASASGGRGGGRGAKKIVGRKRRYRY